MIKFTYYPVGTCSSRIDIELDEQGVLQHVEFWDGCQGNLQGLSVLLRGMNAKEAANKLQGIRCGLKPTSCPDQLATALRKALEKMENAEK